MRRRSRPTVEGLEGRILLYATSGAAWPHPNLITYSIVPDGTNVAGYASNLVQTFDAKWSLATWVDVFAQAAAVWQQAANINLIPVSDNGTPLAQGPDQQGDPNMGDIRISGLPSSVLGSSTLGFAFFPPPNEGGSGAGDIILNTSQPWQINSDYDLLTVAIHEFGHALGMSHSAIASADMYAYYNGGKQWVTPDDVAGIDSIYGARQPDGFTTYDNNGSLSTAADLTPFLTPQGQFAAEPLDIQNMYQAEYFKVTVPANATNSMVVTVQATGLSMLSPALTVYNSLNGAPYHNIGNAGSYDAYGSTISLKINGILPGQVFYIRTGGAGGASAAGNYGLQVNFSASPLYPFASPTTTTLAAADTGGGALTETKGGKGDGDGPIHGLAPSLARLDGDALTIALDPPAPAVQPAPTNLLSPLLLALPPDPFGLSDPSDPAAPIPSLIPGGPGRLLGRPNAGNRMGFLSA